MRPHASILNIRVVAVLCTNSLKLTSAPASYHCGTLSHTHAGLALPQNMYRSSTPDHNMPAVAAGAGGPAPHFGAGARERRRIWCSSDLSVGQLIGPTAEVVPQAASPSPPRSPACFLSVLHADLMAANAESASHVDPDTSAGVHCCPSVTAHGVLCALYADWTGCWIEHRGECTGGGHGNRGGVT